MQIVDDRVAADAATVWAALADGRPDPTGGGAVRACAGRRLAGDREPPASLASATGRGWTTRWKCAGSEGRGGLVAVKAMAGRRRGEVSLTGLHPSRLVHAVHREDASDGPAVSSLSVCFTVGAHAEALRRAGVHRRGLSD